MGHKKVCFQCRKAYSIKIYDDSLTDYKCPQCGLKAIILNHKFRPPKREDKKSWDVAKYLVDHAFRFDHVSDNGLYVQYPTTMEEAETFVIKYKRQAYFPPQAD
jgi:predicted RNA-binding Zn-ribbon protein involved in translation (DUF1610 family)